MIDFSKLQINKKGQVTLASVMDFLLYCSSEERWDAFWEITHDELAEQYPITWKTFYKGLQFAYGSGKAAPSEAQVMFEECQFDWYEYSTKKEQRFYDSIDADQYLYRGCTMEEKDSGKFGVSWTTDKGVAEFFAYRFKDILEGKGKHPCVIRVPFREAFVCGVLLDRDEKELVVPYFEHDDVVEIDSTEPTVAYEKYQAKRRAKTMKVINKDDGALMGNDGSLYALDGTLLAAF